MRKGIILAGGTGSRLFPMTQVVSKQLLPVYDKPMIYYPISTLMQAGITEILLICRPADLSLFRALLQDGTQWGISLQYAEQAQPNGLAEALIIAEDFLDGGPSALILGDNLFYGDSLTPLLTQICATGTGAGVFAYHVSNPQDYGVISFDDSGKKKKAEDPARPRPRLDVDPKNKRPNQQEKQLRSSTEIKKHNPRIKSHNGVTKRKPPSPPKTPIQANLPGRRCSPPETSEKGNRRQVKKPQLHGQ